MPDEETEQSGESATDDTDETLRNEGVKALEQWKQRAKAAEAEARKTKTLETELQRLRESNQSEAEKALAQARKEGADEATATLNAALAKARLETEVLRTAGAKLADPGDALRFIDPLEVTGPDGLVNPKALTKAVDDLLAAKPYLAASNGPIVPGVPAGVREGSNSGGQDMNALIRRAAGRG